MAVGVYVAKTSFADIYEQWTRSHDESSAIDKRYKKTAKTENVFKDSINEIRRMKAQDALDLHSYTLEEAIVTTRNFLSTSKQNGLRKVLIITGKGLHSAGGEAVLRPTIINIANAHPAVREVSTPKAAEGGSGALIVILKA